MGSPSGKSHDSSDSDSWGRRQQLIGASLDTDGQPSASRELPRDGGSLKRTGSGAAVVGESAVGSPGQKRRISGETRLDRLVRYRMTN